MLSPFTYWMNAVISVPVPTEEMMVDNAGNPIPKTSTEKITAILKWEKSLSDSKLRDIQGQDLNELIVKGRLIDPMDFPDNVEIPLECECEIDNRKGIIRIPFLIHSPFNSEQIVGRKIIGFFRIK